MQADSFVISYSRLSSEAFARKLAEDLKSRGYRVWLDVLDIQAGDPWDTAIQQALDGASTIMVILSKTSVSSRNVLDEVSYMLNRGKRVIPILTEDCRIPYRIDSIQYIDFRNGYGRGVQCLIEVLDNGASATGAYPPNKPSFSESVNAVEEKHGQFRLKAYLLTGLGILIVGALVAWFVSNGNRRSGQQGGKGLVPRGDSAAVFYDSAKPAKKAAQMKPRGPRNFSARTFISAAGYQGYYEAINDELLVRIIPPSKSNISLYFDVNQNGQIDDRVDRCYSSIYSNPQAICSLYIQDNGKPGTCGDVHTQAFVSQDSHEVTIVIPFKEICPEGSDTIVFQCIFVPANNQSLVLFPGRPGAKMIDFGEGNVYTLAL